MSDASAPVPISRRRFAAGAGAAGVAGSAAIWNAQPSQAFDRSRLGRMVFHEDFSRFSLHDRASGRGRWFTQYSAGGPADGYYVRTHGDSELQCYVDPAFRDLGLNPFRVRTTPRGAELDILLRPTPPRFREACFGKPFISGMITTRHSFALDRGYWEITARMPRTMDGLWPAIWLLPTDDTAPPEIDIVEIIKGRTICTWHTGQNGRHEFDPTRVRGLGDLSDRFHTFGLWKDHDVVLWLIDGRPVKQSPVARDQRQPFFLLINLAIAHSSARGRISPDTHGVMTIRDVRAWAPASPRDARRP